MPTSDDRGLPPGLAEVFTDHPPPAGGLAALRTRIADDRPVWRRWVGPVALAVTVAVALLFLSRPAPTQTVAMITADPGYIGLGLTAVPADPVVVAPGAEGRIAVQRVALLTDRVVLYRVAGTRTLPERLDKRPDIRVRSDRPR